jgi:hypothetical protein
MFPDSSRIKCFLFSPKLFMHNFFPSLMLTSDAYFISDDFLVDPDLLINLLFFSSAQDTVDGCPEHISSTHIYSLNLSIYL